MAIRVAIVGTGNIARSHVQSLQSLGEEEVELVGAVDIDDDRLSAFCEQYGLRNGYDNVADLLEKDQPQLVHVCTPPGAHAEVALKCLRAGVNVVVEKPPTLTLAEFDTLVEAEKESSAWLATIFQHRFGSGALRLQELMAEGVLGRPLVAICNTLWFRDQAYFDVVWRGRWDTEGGGPTMGHGIHQIDLLSAIMGRWTEVSAIARQQARTTDTEDVTMGTVAFANGAIASMVNSILSPREESYLRFDFEYATVEVSHLYGYGDGNWTITPAKGYEDKVLPAWEAGPHGTRSGFVAQFPEVLKAVREGTPPPVTSSESRRTLELVAATYASAFQRRPIRPEDLGPDSPFYQRMEGDGPRW
ncbi:Gfo/Idh/MocA family oxidoreductase [Kribbella sp. NPDC050820]|uniref:Gfo/Idh/MocA family protein n=1 Tax=Kribbella sp. NPDC050820 TaxID=3155408 RepID=UPI0033C0C239